VRQVRRSAKLIEGHMTVWQPVRSSQQHQLKERSIFRVSITEGVVLPDHESIVPAPSTHFPNGLSSAMSVRLADAGRPDCRSSADKSRDAIAGLWPGDLGRLTRDDYLDFVAGRCRPNTVLATAYDLRIFFAVVGKDPAQVSGADVFGFITAQRHGGDGRLQLAGDGGGGVAVGAASPVERVRVVRLPARPG
jgi:hypothetical protein